ncbi:hypothetical protein IU450_36035 [Nocardia abscessus]|uniref:hypothetical protein n=1 Tax=Nocardia abscessus TaxID=120957 RepID=UPI001895F731|nr:hypothetical protein [Nocardia abscessus]MBF6341252.1 hypothetical protein [Nocardia abscessus]
MTDALLSSEHSALARQQLARLVAHYRRTYGLLIDAEAATVTVDPGFDALGAQQHREAILHARKARLAKHATATLIAAAGLPGENQARALRAVSDLRGGEASGRLDAALATAGVGEVDRRRVVFVRAYLLGDTVGVDLLTDAPVMVDARAELTGMLRREMEEARHARGSDFLGPGADVIGPWFEAATLSLSEPDRRFARQLQMAVTHGSRTPELPWPRQAHRAELEELVWSYTAATRDVHQAAERLAVDPDAFTDRVLDQVHRLLSELHTTRTAIVEQIDRGEGLLGIERLRVRQILDQFTTGAAEMPALLFVSERHKQIRDMTRYSDQVHDLANRAERAIQQVLDQAGIAVMPMDPAAEVAGAISDIVCTSVQKHIYDLAEGHEAYDEDRRGRISFTAAAHTLDRALSDAGIAPQQRTQLRCTLDDLNASAEALSAPLRQRRQAWHDRVTDLTGAAEPDPLAHTTDPLMRALFIETTPPTQFSSDAGTAIDAVFPPGIQRSTALNPADSQTPAPAVAERGASAHL